MPIGYLCSFSYLTLPQQLVSLMFVFGLTAPQRSAVPLFFYLFTVALISVLAFPIRALFLVDVLRGTAFENGLTYAVPAIASVFITPVIGAYSDNLRERRTIITISLLMLGVGCAAHAYVQTSWAFVLVAAVFFPFFSVAISQFFAWAKEREVQRFGGNGLGSSELRVGYIAGWVCGPVIAGLLLAGGLTYRGVFLLQAFGFVLLAAIVWAFSSYRKEATASVGEVFRWSGWRGIPKSLMLIAFFVAFVLAGDMIRLANLAFFVDEYISQDPLVLSIVFSATPLVEVPATVAFIWAGKRYSEKTVLGVGVVAGIVYFSFSPFAQNIESCLSCKVSTL